jgi:DNA polymerase (family 10)
MVASADAESDIMEKFTSLEEVTRIIMQGPTRSSVRLANGMSVDLRVVPKEDFGATLHHFTGSKAHNIALRKMAKERKMKINEYGIYKDGIRLGGEKEHDIYTHLGLDYVEPEMRENRGEITLAQNHALPKLIELSDIQGDLHMHTRYSDGMDTIEEMARAAIKRGYAYIAITDHTKHLTVAHGLDEKRLKEQLEEIDRLNDTLKEITILKSAEVDILEDGSLDLPDEILKELDLTVCGIHYKFNLSKQKQTSRILKAMEHPAFTIFAHPTGRLINLREPYTVDMEKVFHAAKQRGCILELNAQPDRLDLDDRHCKMAKEMEIPVAISTDAHSVHNLKLMHYGIGQARRGWLEKEDVVNTRSLASLMELLRTIKG